MQFYCANIANYIRYLELFLYFCRIKQNQLNIQVMVASRIKHVSIRKIWGVKNISTDFHEHINIFIGSNGSSKTTFLNLIEAALICDINTFANIEFESIDIVFSNSCINKLIIKKAYRGLPCCNIYI